MQIWMKMSPVRAVMLQMRILRHKKPNVRACPLQKDGSVQCDPMLTRTLMCSSNFAGTLKVQEPHEAMCHAIWSATTARGRRFGGRASVAHPVSVEAEKNASRWHCHQPKVVCFIVHSTSASLYPPRRGNFASALHSCVPFNSWSHWT